MADCNFLEKAIQFVRQASDEDEKENYKEALRLYQLSLNYFITALKCKLLIITPLLTIKSKLTVFSYFQMKRMKNEKKLLDKRQLNIWTERKKLRIFWKIKLIQWVLEEVQGRNLVWLDICVN